MPILTIRLTDEEKRILTMRSRKAGLKKATFVRQLIREQPYETAADVLADMAKHWGDERLRVGRK
jgi:predicted DNA-binding protein